MAKAMTGEYDQREPDQWRSEVLPSQLEKYWDDPDGLSMVVRTAIADGYAADLEDATNRLILIDDDKERAFRLRGMMLLACMRFDEARHVLDAYRKKHEPSSEILALLAKVEYQLGDTEAARQCVIDALEVDPNQDKVLQWWIDTVGQQEGFEIVEVAAQQENAWRPKLVNAARMLNQGETSDAVDVYSEVLANANPDAINIASRDLANQGRSRELIFLIGERFDLRAQGPAVGVRLLRAYVDTGDVERGRKLFEELQTVDSPVTRAALSEFAGTFEPQPLHPLVGEPSAGETPPTQVPIAKEAIEPEELLIPDEQFVAEPPVEPEIEVEPHEEAPAKEEESTELPALSPVFYEEPIEVADLGEPETPIAAEDLKEPEAPDASEVPAWLAPWVEAQQGTESTISESEPENLEVQESQVEVPEVIEILEPSSPEPFELGMPEEISSYEIPEVESTHEMPEASVPGEPNDGIVELPDPSAGSSLSDLLEASKPRELPETFADMPGSETPDDWEDIADPWSMGTTGTMGKPPTPSEFELPDVDDPWNEPAPSTEIEPIGPPAVGGFGEEEEAVAPTLETDVEFEGKQKVLVLAFDAPIWFEPLHSPRFLVPAPDEGWPTVAIAALADLNAAGSASGRTDEIARLTAGIPLALAESLQLGSHTRASALLRVTESGRPIVFREIWSAQRIAHAAGNRYRAIITGGISAEGKQITVHISAHDAQTRQPLHSATRTATTDAIGDAVSSLGKEMAARLRQSGHIGGSVPTDLMTPPGGGLLRDYVVLQGQAVEVILADSDDEVPTGAERAMFDNALHISSLIPEATPVKLTLLAGLVAAHARGSENVARSAKSARQLLIGDATEHDAYLKLLLPLTERILGTPESFQAMLAEAKEQAGPEYAEWLDSL